MREFDQWPTAGRWPLLSPMRNYSMQLVLFYEDNMFSFSLRSLNLHRSQPIHPDSKISVILKSQSVIFPILRFLIWHNEDIIQHFYLPPSFLLERFFFNIWPCSKLYCYCYWAWRYFSCQHGFTSSLFMLPIAYSTRNILVEECEGTWRVAPDIKTTFYQGHFRQSTAVYCMYSSGMHV